MTISALNQQFGIKDHLDFFEGTGSLPCVKINNEYATCILFLYGAHVLSFIPAGQPDLLWMSDTSAFELGKAIRGGIPLCFPWFGPHASDSNKPQHGFARLSEWEVKSTQQLQNGSTELVLTLNENEETLLLWPFLFEAELRVVVGSAFVISLQIKNTGDKTFTYTDAMHTYFNISDLANLQIAGLAGTSWYNGFASETTVQQEEILSITTEENRRYINHETDCVITDAGYQRNIIVSKTGSKVTVVWNPYKETAKSIGDMPDDGYNTFICVEAANAYTDAVVLEPGQMHTISQTFSVQ